MNFMITLEIGPNDGGQRLDRFLRKYLPKAPLAMIYKTIRKDVKVNGRRPDPETLLQEGDQLCLYLTEDTVSALRAGFREPKALKQFAVVYEDERLLAVSKPFGLLTHGDGVEKKNTLANQVIAYLIQKGEYSPRTEKTFVPSPVNRLDRNTTGLVLFGKDAATLKELNQRFRDREGIRKFYLTIVSGELKEDRTLSGHLRKDREANLSTLADNQDPEAREAACIVRPIAYARVPESPSDKKKTGPEGITLVEVELLTGRSHQIRVQLAGAGHPIIGDVKYGNPAINQMMKRLFGLTTQLLHAHRLLLPGLEIQADPPAEFQKIRGVLFHDEKTGRRQTLENKK